MHVDFKITTWERCELPDNLTEEEVNDLKDKISRGVITNYQDLEEEVGNIPHNEIVLEVEEYMNPDENGGESTVELLIDTETIATNEPKALNIDYINVMLAEYNASIVESLKAQVKDMLNNIELYGEMDNVLLHEWDISQPIQNNCSDGNLTETISGLFIHPESDKLVFTIDTYNSGYDVESDSISIENLIYLHENLISIEP